jgi:hypothetical protein
MAGLQNISRTDGGAGLTRARLDEVAEMALRLVDPVHGGTQGAPKFPQPAFFKFLWRGYKRTGSLLYRESVLLTLEKICQGGIYDHLGGGFARYSTDPVWLAPHFEKMLYDNAQLIELLTEAWQETASPLYAARVRETVAWAVREMRVTDGGEKTFAFASAYDADSEGEEGRFYVWSEADIDRLLGDEAAAVFKDAYDVTPYGNWEGKNILNRSDKPALGNAAYEKSLAASRGKLLEHRNHRVWPSWDDKVLADWNGLMIAALAFAGAAFGEPAWIEAAATAFDFVRTRMRDGDRLFHAWRAGQAKHPAVIDDYANMSRAALLLHEVTGDGSYLEQARSWIESADAHHWDAANGGYFLAADDTADLIVRAKTVHDNATPAGNGVMVEVLARLYHLTGDAAYRTRAEETVRAFCGEDARPVMAMPSLLAGYELLENAVQAVIVSADGGAAAHGLVEAAFAAPVPNRIVLQVHDGASLPPEHPAAGKEPKDGQATAYVCIGTTCGLPVTNAAALRAAMTAP